MSCNAVDHLLRLFACLNAHSAPLPGRPPAFRPQVALGRRRLMPVISDDGYVIGYSRAQCGASQTQTRSYKVGSWSPLDVAGAAGMAHFDEEDRWLCEYVVGDAKRKPLLRVTLASEIVAQAKFAGWKIAAHAPDAIADLALDMLIDADGCGRCNTSGIALCDDGALGQCPDCRGTGHVPLSERKAAARLRVPRATYNRHYRIPLDWTMRVLQGRVWSIDERIREGIA